MPNDITIEKSAPASSAWVPSPDFIETTNLAWLMRRVGVDSYKELHQWSVQNRGEFWRLVIERLDIRFQQPFSRAVEESLAVYESKREAGASVLKDAALDVDLTETIGELETEMLKAAEELHFEKA
ncbi:MAG: hypothetical protein ABSF34_12070, partial [Verrucomicrobiota bacterium]